MWAKTFGELAKERLNGETFDWAIPQEFFDQLGGSPAGHVVWLYEGPGMWGVPFPLTLKGWILLRIHDLKFGGRYATTKAVGQEV